MALLFANEAKSKLAADISPAGTTITVTSGEGTKFPVITDGDTFMVTIRDSTGAYEIVSCTARTADTMTVVRGQEGTTARSFSAGAYVGNNFTAGSISSFNTYAMASNAEADAGTATNLIMNPADTKYFWDRRVSTYAATLLDDTNAAAARTTLGLGNAATGTIGTTVQGYDANTVKKNVYNAYSRPQRAVPVSGTVVDGVFSIDASTQQDILLYPITSANLTMALPTSCVAGDYITVTGYSSVAGGTTLAWPAGWLGPKPTTLRYLKWFNFSARCINTTNWLFLGFTEAE